MAPPGRHTGHACHMRVSSTTGPSGQTFESEWITMMNRQILGPGLRQRDPMSLRSCRRLPEPQLVRHEQPPAP